MTVPLTLQPKRPMEPTTTANTTSTQLFGVIYINLTGLVDYMVPNSSPWSLLGQFLYYIIKLAPILWWELPTGPVVLCPESPNASNYALLPENLAALSSGWVQPIPLKTSNPGQLSNWENSQTWS
ncbi:hypothetical protein DSO57_1012016 [Entomophthora muscae]|uniref:Uncharacterized protein n=1 Tax=Entomophthora muscae TaxID=34485 RepID=A0ACC2UEZ5_9FUNG|nr:hypothetical protein DSO57_1012016 [Entomophthora muscae]